MGIEELNNDLLVDLNTTFEESLKTGFYPIAWSENDGRKRFLCVTKDGQYSFYFAIEDGKLEMLDNRKEVSEGYTLNEIIENLQGFFSFKYNYFSIDSYKEYELEENNLKDIGKLENLLIELKRKLVKGDVNKILS